MCIIRTVVAIRTNIIFQMQLPIMREFKFIRLQLLIFCANGLRENNNYIAVLR